MLGSYCVNDLKEFMDEYINVEVSLHLGGDLSVFWEDDQWQTFDDTYEEADVKIVTLRFLHYDKSVANVKLCLMPITSIYSDAIDIVDQISADYSEGFYYMESDLDFNMFHSTLCDDITYDLNIVYAGVLKTLYVNPEYRNNGIASFVVANLDKFLHLYFGWHLVCLVTYLNPFHKDTKGNYAKQYAFDNGGKLDEQDQKMLDLLKSKMPKWDFYAIEDAEDYYIKFFVSTLD